MVPTTVEKDLSTCLGRGLARLAAAYRLSLPLPQRPQSGELWDTIEWQRMKRLIARVVALCICSILRCPVYLGDFHGGEPSEGLGGKDVDLVLDCSIDSKRLSRIEKLIESMVKKWLDRLIGLDSYTALGIPNIIELHSTREYLFKKYVEAGPPYVIRLC
jgi:hypothetical protein